MPAWINRLAYLTTFVPFIEKIIPKEWISPLAMQNSVDNQLQSTASSSVVTPSPPPATTTTTSDSTSSSRSTSSFFKNLEKLISKN